MEELKRLRSQLELCDDMILDALRLRYQIVADITLYKHEHDLPVVHLDEDARKLAHADSRLEGEPYKESILSVYDSIRFRSKFIQSMNLFDGNIFLIGFMGTGKSTISSTLHNVFAMEVIEMDQLIAERNGMSISEIFENNGEEYFRNEETNLLIEIQDRKNVIISCGGGVPMRDVNIQEMKKSGKIVLLTASPETILKRVSRSHDRPLLENNKNVGFITELLEKRRDKYEAAADIIINTDGKNSIQICEEIINRVKKQ